MLCLLLASIFYLTTGTQQNIYVKHAATKHVSESRWIAAFPLDLSVYKQPIETIAEHLHDVTRFAIFCQGQIAKHQRNEHYDPVTQLVLNQINFAKQRIKTLRIQSSEIEDVLVVHKTRSKRSLLPFLGNLLSGLTGVATEDEVKIINQQIALMTKNDEELTHIVENSITVVNVTKHQLDHISRTVNSVMDAMETFQQVAYNTTKELFERIDHEDLLFKCLAHPTLIMNTLLHNVATASMHLTSLHNLITDTLQGRLTTNVIRPNQLLKLLQDIDKNTAQDLFLPYDLKQDLLHYYRDLSTHLTMSATGPTIVLSIPLKSLVSTFTFYQVMRFPVPYRDTSLLLSYSIPHPYLALSKDYTKVVYLTEKEFFSCTQAKGSLCHFQSPIRFSEQVATDCSTSLVTTGSVSNCNVTLTPNNMVLPQSYWLADGKWLIVHTKPQLFTVMCVSQAAKTVTTRTPADILELPIGCKAQSQSMAIPPTYYSRPHLKFVDVKEFINYNVTTYDRLVGPTISMVSIKFPKHLTPLITDDASISQLETQIRRHLKHLVHPVSPFGTVYYHICLPFALLILMGTVVAILVYYYRTRSRTLVTQTSEVRSSIEDLPELVPPPPLPAKLTNQPLRPAVSQQISAEVSV